MNHPEGSLRRNPQGVVVTTPEGLLHKAKVLKERFEENHSSTIGDRYPYVLNTGKVMTIDEAIAYGELRLSGEM